MILLGQSGIARNPVIKWKVASHLDGAPIQINVTTKTKRRLNLTHEQQEQHATQCIRPVKTVFQMEKN